MRARNLLLLLGICLLSLGCGSERAAIKRAKRKVIRTLKKNPSLIDSFAYTVRDTFIRDRILHDTTFKMNLQQVYDTFTIYHDNFTHTIYRENNILSSSLDIKPDTGIKENQVPGIDITREDLKEYDEKKWHTKLIAWLDKKVTLALWLLFFYLLIKLGISVWLKKRST